MTDDQAAQPLDPTDTELLAQVATLYDKLDPPPADLVERLQFALALDEMFAEVAEITRVPVDTLAVRDDAAATRTETVTFSADRLSAMVTVSRGPDGVRIDGWIAPPSPGEVRVRMPAASRTVPVDEDGRFVVEGLPEGFAQLSFRVTDEAGAETVVVTPLFQL